MRVLQLGKFYPLYGGVEKVMWDIAMGLVSRGVSCDMLCAGFKPQVISFGETGSCIVVKSLKNIASTMISPEMVRWMRAHANEYDIIHIHHPDPMACLALRLSGFRGKVVLHWHSDILRQKALLVFYRPLQSWLLRSADRIVGTTPVYIAESKALAKYRNKALHIPIGVETVSEDNEGATRIKALYGGRKIVYSLGRLVGYKGYEHLVDAAAYLDDSYVVVIGGSGPLRDSLQKRIDDSGLSDKVFLVGRISEEDFAAYFRACDVFCLSSVWKTEAFGIVQVEAMSCGKPLVATNIPASGVSWVNAQGDSGLNAEPGDARGLASAIESICSDPEVYASYCARSRARYERMFTFDKMIDNCLALYETL